MRFSRISIVTDKSSWLNSYIDTLVAKLKEYAAEVVLIHDLILLQPSDIVFYLSFSKIVPKKILNQHRHNLVVHGSALPLGKGWSPLTWQILEGRNDIPMTLFEADEALDSGKIYLQKIIQCKNCLTCCALSIMKNIQHILSTSDVNTLLKLKNKRFNAWGSVFKIEKLVMRINRFASPKCLVTIINH